MKSFQQIAQSAYEAYCKEAARHVTEGTTPPPCSWNALCPAEQFPWVAVARQLWAEFSTL